MAFDLYFLLVGRMNLYGRIQLPASSRYRCFISNLPDVDSVFAMKSKIEAVKVGLDMCLYTSKWLLFSYDLGNKRMNHH